MEVFSVQLYLLWLYLTIGIFAYGIFVLFLPSVIPATLATIYKYGKSADTCKRSLLSDLVTVPKRWFLHFYVCACTFHLFLLWSVITVYLRNQPCPAILKGIIVVLSPKIQFTTVTPESVMIATVLMFLQVFRRLYECLYISIFSDAKMSLLHYGFGLFFYPAVGISLVSEAPGFYNNHISSLSTDNMLKANYITGAILFVAGWCIEFNSHWILSNLRKNSKGEVVNTRYAIPKGGFFKFVSCPHYLGEVTMYLAILLIFSGRNITWWSAFLNVLTNQIMAAFMSHQWYQKKFDNYPKERKALIPFLL